MILDPHAMAHATGGVLVRAGPAGPVGIDSRKIGPAQWFLALAGERFDGHDFLPQVAQAGCAGAIAERVPDDWSAGFIAVPNGERALQDIARACRSLHDGPVVGITGSAGKTTTRAMVALVAEARGAVHQTAGNFNNHIGLPLTLLAAPTDAAVWVIEMGMNHLGEIAFLQEIARPTIRLITNVGAAHVEGTGSLDGVARAKGELFDGARPDDVCCVNTDDPRVAALPLPEGVRVLRFGRGDGADARLISARIDPTDLSTRFAISTAGGMIEGRITSPGLHLALNACAAVCVGLALEIPAAEMGARLSAYAPVGMRMRLEDGPRGLRIINDAYNANPLSCAASLRALASVTGARRVALLGDMLELGEAELDGHREVLRLARSLELDLLGLAGPRYAAAVAAEGLAAGPDLALATDAAALAADVTDRLRPADLVLLKGSRGLRMERVLDNLEP